MKIRLKPLRDQVIVLTGATSGIGLATARRAARAGARLVLAARSEDALRQLADEINSTGGQALAVVTDVTREEDLRRLAEAAIERFGGFDTWINNAGISIFGRLMEVDPAEHRQLFETNFWGVVNGSRVAVEHLRSRGGTLINVGSIVSERAIPVQGMYSASKHAVKGFTEALRMELEKDGLPIAVTLVQPTSIDTPFTRAARNYQDRFPSLPPPVYAPEIVAKTILYCATHPTRNIMVGGGAKFISLMARYLPRLTDWWMESRLFEQQKSDRPPAGRQEHALFEARGEGLHERGEYEGHVARSSLYTAAVRRPLVTTALLVGVGAAVLAVMASGTVSATAGRAVAQVRKPFTRSKTGRLRRELAAALGRWG